MGGPQDTSPPLFPLAGQLQSSLAGITLDSKPATLRLTQIPLDQQDAVKEDKYLAQAQSTVTIFEQDLATVRTLLEQSSKNYRVMRTHSWRQQTTDALAKLSSNISAVYSLNPPSRYQGAHAHLMNAAYYIQQFSYLLASAMPACSTCSVDTGMYDEAHNQYLLFVREWGLFKNDIQNAQNAQ